jgi:hypothetical protein
MAYSKYGGYKTSLHNKQFPPHIHSGGEYYHGAFIGAQQ